MRIIKIFSNIILALFFISSSIFSDDDPPVDYAELHIDNMSTTEDICVIIRPVGAIFNGKDDIGKDYRYTPEAYHDFATNRHNFLLGGSKIIYNQTNQTQDHFFWLG